MFVGSMLVDCSSNAPRGRVNNYIDFLLFRICVLVIFDLLLLFLHDYDRQFIIMFFVVLLYMIFICTHIL